MPGATLRTMANVNSYDPRHSTRKCVVLSYPFHRWGNCGSEVTQLAVSDEVMTGWQVFPPSHAAGLSRVPFQAWVRVGVRDRERQDGPNIMTMTKKPTKQNNRKTVPTSLYIILFHLSTTILNIYC